MAKTGSLMADKDTTPTKLAMPRVPLFNRQLLLITTRVRGGSLAEANGGGAKVRGVPGCSPTTKILVTSFEGRKDSKEVFPGGMDKHNKRQVDTEDHPTGGENPIICLANYAAQAKRMGLGQCRQKRL